MPLDANIWFPHINFTLQTISIMYPIHPNDVTMKKYYDTIHNLPLFIPMEPFGKVFSKLLDRYPVTPYLSSRESFMKWTHFIINKLKLHMNWDQSNYYDSLEKYYEEYKPKELMERERFKRSKQYIFIGVSLLLVMVVLYMLRV
jgi:hypothetical protein